MSAPAARPLPRAHRAHCTLWPPAHRSAQAQPRTSAGGEERRGDPARAEHCIALRSPHALWCAPPRRAALPQAEPTPRAPVRPLRSTPTAVPRRSPRPFVARPACGGAARPHAQWHGTVARHSGSIACGDCAGPAARDRLGTARRTEGVVGLLVLERQACICLKPAAEIGSLARRRRTRSSGGGTGTTIGWRGGRRRLMAAARRRCR